MVSQLSAVPFAFGDNWLNFSFGKGMINCHFIGCQFVIEKIVEFSIVNTKIGIFMSGFHPEKLLTLVEVRGNSNMT